VEEVAAPVSHGHARRYDAPALAAPAAAVTDDADAVPAAPYTDDYDLQDYQQEPRAVAADYDDDAPRVIVEGEEEPRRRGGLAWLPLLLALGALVLAGLFLFNTFRNRDPGSSIAGTAGEAGATTTGDGALGGVVGTGTAGTEGAGAVNVVPLDGTVTAETSPGAATAAPDTTGGTTAGPATAGETAAPPDTQTAAVPAPVQTAAAPGAGATAVAGAGATAAPAADATQAPAGAAQTQAPAAAQQTAAPPAQTTIVVVAPSATVVPPTPAPTQAPPPPAPPAAPAAPPDVAAANPAVVPNGTVVQAGQWSFTATNFQNVATGSYGGSPPTRGQYRVVVLQVANNTGQPATIPDGFFVVKDAQGRVYDFNRAASVDYLNRFGGPGVAADIGADTPVPSNNSLTSVPLLFDVPPDATNLVLFSRENMNQGFQLR
jgi:hypothetical protein